MRAGKRTHRKRLIFIFMETEGVSVAAVVLEHTTVPSSISVDYPALTSVLACMHHMYRPHMYMYLVVHSRSGRTLDLGVNQG